MRDRASHGYSHSFERECECCATGSTSEHDRLLGVHRHHRDTAVPPGSALAQTAYSDSDAVASYRVRRPGRTLRSAGKARILSFGEEPRHWMHGWERRVRIARTGSRATCSPWPFRIMTNTQQPVKAARPPYAYAYAYARSYVDGRSVHRLSPQQYMYRRRGPYTPLGEYVYVYRSWCPPPSILRPRDSALRAPCVLCSSAMVMHAHSGRTFSMDAAPECHSADRAGPAGRARARTRAWTDPYGCLQLSLLTAGPRGTPLRTLTQTEHDSCEYTRVKHPRGWPADGPCSAGPAGPRSDSQVRRQVASESATLGSRCATAGWLRPSTAPLSLRLRVVTTH